MFLQVFSDPSSITTILFRFGLSFILSFIVGLEREIDNQPAGLRTHVLISIGSTMFVLVSLLIPTIYKGGLSSDPTRIAAQIVTGIGFLGAGAIIKIGINVKGLTTAANIWVVCSIGMSVGAGYYLPAFILTGVTLITLTLLNLLEKAMIQNRHIKNIHLKFEDSRFYTDRVEELVENFGITIMNIDFSESTVKGITELDINVKIPVKVNIHDLFAEMRKLPNLVRVELTRL
ncbi:MAG: MgtC/SapB family protein [Spirochaetia bacterium]